MSEYRVEPVEGQDYDGRQWGYRMVGPRWTYEAHTGGTGACWNVGIDDDRVHVCDLDSFIEALVALRDSQANADHKARWA